MTTDQAAQVIAQQQQLLDFYTQLQPLLYGLSHDIFPFVAVLSTAALGAALAWAAT